MSNEKPMPERVLDPIERASEAIFGVLMAVSITGSLSVATAGRQEIRTLLITALGCNLAWGLTDAVMYLVSAATGASRTTTQLLALQASPDPGTAHRRVADALPGGLWAGASEETLEAIRKDLLALPAARAGLVGRDYLAALSIFLIVVAVTFPVVIPFLYIRDVPMAMRVSNAVALAILYAYGHLLGHYAGGKAWHYGLAIAALGAGLVAVIMALGG